MGVTWGVSYRQVVSYQPKAMFKSGVMFLLLAVLTVQVVQIAGFDFGSDLIPQRRILPSLTEDLVKATATGGTKELDRANIATPSSACLFPFCKATKSKQCCLRNERGKYATFIL